jgi:hypothetical protein
MKIETLPLAVVKPYWRNPRDNTKAVEIVAQSITDYGFNVPLVVDKEYVILAGHTRYKALQQLGITEVQVVVVDLPAQKAKEFRIADNKTSEVGEWDMPKLMMELKEISDLPRIQDYFPNLDIQSVVDSLPKNTTRDVLPSDIDNRTKLLASDYTTRNTQEMRGFIPMLCPDCGYEYSLRIDEIQKMIDGISKMLTYDNPNALSELRDTDTD